MKKRLYTFICCFAGIALAACSNEPTLPEPALKLASSASEATISANGLQVDATFTTVGGILDITVESNWNWNLEVNSGNWCAVETTETGLRMVLPANPLLQSREARITVSTANETGSQRAIIHITQSSADASQLEVRLNEGDSEIILPEAGGSYRVDVTASGAWSATAGNGWCGIEQDEQGFTVSAPRNTTINALATTINVVAGSGAGSKTITILASQFSTVSAMVFELTVGELTENVGGLPFENTGVVNCTVDWGDGKLQRVVAGWPLHQYEQPGVYEVRVIGKVTSLMAAHTTYFSDNIKTCVTGIKRWGNLGLETIKKGFYKCINLASIATPERESFAKLTSAYETFYSCTALTAIPEGMFANAPLLETAYSVFTSCENIRAVPARLFAGNNKCTTFFRAFWRCTSLTEIAPDAFEGCTAVTNFGQAFYFTPITSIPNGLFAPCVAATDFSNTFYGCTELASLPADLFAHNTAVLNYTSVFAGCGKLTTIPTGLFAASTKATNLSGALNACTALRTVPANLFTGLTAVTNFNSTFLGCTALESVPTSIFDDNKAVTNFGKTFSGCTALHGESPYTMVDGTKVHLYQRNENAAFTEVKTMSGCFTDCNGLSDYTTISTSYPGWCPVLK